jgi:phosphatidylglycerol lysyltransferase
VPSSDAPITADSRPRVLALLRRHGWNATSFQVLEPGFEYFFDAEDACVAYVETHGAWVAAGAPIAPVPRLAEVAERFVAAARSRGRRAVLSFTEQRFVESTPFAALRVGEQPVWDPSTWDVILTGSRSLREQLRRARAKGVQVRRLDHAEIAQPELPMRQAIQALVRRWLRSRSMAPMGFLVQVHLFDFIEERQLFVAENASGLCGVLMLVPVYARGGYLVEDLLRAPATPNGTSELLIDAAMRYCAAEGCSFLTLGLAPLAGEVGPWLRLARRLGRGLYDFAGLRAFKAKLMPSEWAPIYISYPRERSALLAIHDTLAAFAHGGLVRFGVASLLRGPPFLLHALMVMLLPWTTALAWLDGERYFPSPWLKWAWVCFDLALIAALGNLIRRPRPHIARLLSRVIAADASLTLIEALWFNLPRAHHGYEFAAMAIAVAAPAGASLVLRNVWRRTR